MSAIRWRRTDEGASEILTLVRINDGPLAGELAIEICSGPAIGDDFIGLYSVGGSSLSVGTTTWEAVDEKESTPEAIEKIRRDWECGTSTVERLTVQS
jgi:hypothetical protein